MGKILIMKFRDLNDNWIDEKNNQSDDDLIFVQRVFHFLQMGESVWLERGRIISKHEIKEGYESQPSIFFRSSGTSGKKKWIEHNENSIQFAIKGLLKWLQEDDLSSWCCLPINHVGGMMPIFRAIFTNGKILFFDYRKLLEEIHATLIVNKWISLVPTQLYTLLWTPIGCENLRRFKGIFVGGAALSEKIIARCKNQDIPVFPTYGMTETAGMVTVLDTESFHAGVDGVGKVLSHAQMEAESKDMRISIKSDSMYLNFEDEKEWLETPDYGREDKDGNWIISGRLDRIIVSGGIKVDPYEIEKILLQHECVNECLVLGVEDEKWGQKIIAYITPRDIAIDSVKQFARERLPSRLLPKVWKTVQCLPLNAMGKPNI